MYAHASAEVVIFVVIDGHDGLWWAIEQESVNKGTGFHRMVDAELFQQHLVSEANPQKLRFLARALCKSRGLYVSDFQKRVTSCRLEQSDKRSRIRKREEQHNTLPKRRSLDRLPCPRHVESTQNHPQTRNVAIDSTSRTNLAPTKKPVHKACAMHGLLASRSSHMWPQLAQHTSVSG